MKTLLSIIALALAVSAYAQTLSPNQTRCAKSTALVCLYNLHDASGTVIETAALDFPGNATPFTEYAAYTAAGYQASFLAAEDGGTYYKPTDAVWSNVGGYYGVTSVDFTDSQGKHAHIELQPIHQTIGRTTGWYWNVLTTTVYQQ